MMFTSTVSKFFFLQRHVQYRVKRLMHVPTLFFVLVDYAKQRCLRVSHGNVFRYVAVDVHEVDVAIHQRKSATRSRMITVVCYVCVGTQYLGQAVAESNRSYRIQKFGERYFYMAALGRKLDVRRVKDVFWHGRVHCRNEIAQTSVVALGNYRRVKMHVIQRDGVIALVCNDVIYGARNRPLRQAHFPIALQFHGVGQFGRVTGCHVLGIALHGGVGRQGHVKATHHSDAISFTHELNLLG